MTHLHKTAQIRTRRWFYIFDENNRPLLSDQRTFAPTIQIVSPNNRWVFKTRRKRKAVRMANKAGKGFVAEKIQLVCGN